MRIVRTASGDVVLDETGRAAGRGAYLCRSAGCLDRAIAKGALSRALKARLPIDLHDALARSLPIPNMKTTVEGGALGQE